VVTHRPEYTVPWSSRAHLSAVTLNRLNRAQSADMVDKLTAAMTLPAETADQIVAKSDGVPLFVEELTKAVLEFNAPRDRSGGRAESGQQRLVVPSTLHDTLMARLDRASGAKDVAQTAAVLGREFSEALLAAVSPLDPETLASALDELVDAELLFRGTPPHTSYIFKHALVQDAAYETLLLSRRQQLHARTAEALEQTFPDIAESQPELLAHHYDAAGMADRAIAYWQRAAARSSAAFNYAEAEHQLARAIALVPQLVDDRQKPIELDLQMALGKAYRAIRGTGSSQTERTYARVRTLCEEIGDIDQLLEAIYGQFMCAFNRPKVHDAGRYAREFAEAAQRERDPATLLVAHQLAGLAAFLLGDFPRTREHMERSLRVEGVDLARLNLISQRQHPSSPLTYLAWTLFALGYPAQARARAKQSLAASEGAFLHAMALGNECYLHHFCGDCAAVEANVAAMLDLSAEKGLIVFHEIGRVFQGWTLAHRGVVEDGITMMRDATARLDVTEQKVEQPYMISILAETYLQAGRWPEAQEQLDVALRRVQDTDERWYESELHRLAGEIALARGDVADAEVQFKRALDVATAQSARMWALRAATRLTHLWRDAGRTAEARALLAPILDGFTEGFEMADLVEGKALLDELA
jgi:predicted ATPase